MWCVWYVRTPSIAFYWMSFFFFLRCVLAGSGYVGASLPLARKHATSSVVCKKCLLNIAGFCSKLCPDTIKDIEIKITEHKGEYIDTKVFLNMYRGIIIGHSFVKGFVDHLAGQNGGVPMSDAGVAEALKVSDGVGAVRLFGVSGARVLGNFTLPDIKYWGQRFEASHFTPRSRYVGPSDCGDGK